MPDRGGQSPNAHLIVAASAGEDKTITIAITPNTNNTGPFKNERNPKINDKKVFTKEVAKFNIIISPIKDIALTQYGSELCLGSDLIPMVLLYEHEGADWVTAHHSKYATIKTSSLRSKLFISNTPPRAKKYCFIKTEKYSLQKYITEVYSPFGHKTIKSTPS